MPKYWGKQIFTHGRFPEVVQKTEKKRKKDRKYVITMASYALQRHLGWQTQSRLGQCSQNCILVFTGFPPALIILYKPDNMIIIVMLPCQI